MIASLSVHMCGFECWGLFFSFFHLFFLAHSEFMHQYNLNWWLHLWLCISADLNVGFFFVLLSSLFFLAHSEFMHQYNPTDDCIDWIYDFWPFLPHDFVQILGWILQYWHFLFFFPLSQCFRSQKEDGFLSSFFLSPFWCVHKCFLF